MRPTRDFSDLATPSPRATGVNLIVHYDKPQAYGSRLERGGPLKGEGAPRAVPEGVKKMTKSKPGSTPRRRRKRGSDDDDDDDDATSAPSSAKRPRRSGSAADVVGAAAAPAPAAAADDASSAFTPSQQLTLAGAQRLRVVAVDPGRVAIVTCGEWVVDASGKPRWASWQLTRSQFYAETGYQGAMRKRSLWNLEVAEAHAALATVSVRTSRMPQFDAYLRVLETHLEDLWANREHTCWMRLVRAPLLVLGCGDWGGGAAPRGGCGGTAPHRPPPHPQDFAGKRAAMKSREGFWRRVRAGRACDGTLGIAPTIAYGDAGFSSSGKGGMAAPTSAMRRSCVAVLGRDSVVAVDEFSTTAKHATTPDGRVCGEFLSDVIDQRVGHCKRASCCGSGATPRRAASGVVSRGLKR